MEQQVQTSVAVIGGGPGGYTAAFRLADLGIEVCLIESDGRLGGVCLHVGCIPSKTLLHAAAVIEEARAVSEYGVLFEPPRIDLVAMRSHKAKIIAQLTNGLDGLCKARRITRLSGHASFLDSHTLLVRGQDTTSRVTFANAIIATGSHPALLADVPADRRIWNSSDALALHSVPERLLIIGGGIIGLEMAQIYSVLGSAVTIVEVQNQLIPPADRDLVQPLFLNLKKKYRIWTETTVASIRPDPDGVEVACTGKTAVTERFDAVLVALGRQPNTQGLGFGTIGLVVDSRGFLSVNNRLQTAIPHIFAVGDVTGAPMLAHKATHQGKVAAEVIAGHADAVFAPQTIPSVAYTIPEIAWMGLTEKEAERSGIAYDKGKFPWGASGRALSAGAGTGVSKALFDPSTGRLLGAGICGLNAGELIHEAVLALEMGATARDISTTVHAHPTLAETFAYTAELVDGSITDMLPSKKKG